MKNWSNLDQRPEHIRIYMNTYGEIPLLHHIHHVDNNHDNNQIDNLIALPRALHKSLHGNYYFYLNIAKAGLIDKKILTDVILFYQERKYPFNKNFSVVFVEFLLSRTSFDLSKNHAMLAENNKANERKYLSVDAKKVMKYLSPSRKQMDFLFKDNLIEKMSKDQLVKMLKETLKRAGKAYGVLKGFENE